MNEPGELNRFEKLDEAEDMVVGMRGGTGFMHRFPGKKVDGGVIVDLRMLVPSVSFQGNFIEASDDLVFDPEYIKSLAVIPDAWVDAAGQSNPPGFIAVPDGEFSHDPEEN